VSVSCLSRFKSGKCDMTRKYNFCLLAIYSISFRKHRRSTVYATYTERRAAVEIIIPENTNTGFTCIYRELPGAAHSRWSHFQFSRVAKVN